MTLRNPSLLNRRAHVLCPLWLGLFAAVGVNASALSMPQRVIGTARNLAGFKEIEQSSPVPGYLNVMGASPLRFAPLPTPPPPRPVRIAPPPADPAPATPGKAVEPPPAEEPETTPEPKAIQPETGPKPVSILPDDTPRDLRAEDVLPFFQLPMDPAGGPGATVVVPFTPATPAGTTVQPSSATYQLK